MKKLTQIFLIVTILLGCSTTRDSDVYLNSQAAKLKFKKALILWDAIPINTPEPSEYQWYNARTIYYILKKYDIDCKFIKDKEEKIDMISDPSYFSKSNMQKLCEDYDVDLIIIPEYMVSSCSNDAIIYHTNEFTSTVVLRFYSSAIKDYIGYVRSYASYHTINRVLTTFSPLSYFLSSDAAPFVIVGAVIADIIIEAKSKGNRWRDCFTEAIEDGLARFMNKYYKIEHKKTE